MSKSGGYHAGPGDMSRVDKNPEGVAFQSYAKSIGGEQVMNRAEKYADLAPLIIEGDLLEKAPGIMFVMGTLEWLDEHRDQTPGKVTTDSEVGDRAEGESDDWLDGYISGYQEAGGVILDDPVKTNAELIEDALGQFSKLPDWEKRLIATELDKRGMKAPE